MKTIVKSTLIGSLLGISLLALGACSKNNSNIEDTGRMSIIDVSADGTTTLVSARLALAASDDFSYSDNELGMLLHMKEEEKLARDVYSALYEKWKIPVFSNISKSENTHMNAVIFLLKNYGEEYTGVEEVGKFTNPEFQKLYDKLIASGSESLAEAFKTGALIEDLDIKDLMDYLDEVTNDNIIMVFENLTKGSRNHLRAFNRQLVRLGITYTPEYISQEEFDNIISSPHETGNVYQRGRYGRPYRGGW
jgi:hypothetical protein